MDLSSAGHWAPKFGAQTHRVRQEGTWDPQRTAPGDSPAPAHGALLHVPSPAGQAEAAEQRVGAHGEWGLQRETPRGRHRSPRHSEKNCRGSQEGVPQEDTALGNPVSPKSLAIQGGREGAGEMQRDCRRASPSPGKLSLASRPPSLGALVSALAQHLSRAPRQQAQ